VRRRILKRSEDEDLYFVLFTQTKKPVKTLVADCLLKEEVEVHQFRRITCLSYERGKFFDETHNPDSVGSSE